MEFNQLYEKSIRLWPIQIDISDGKEVNDGTLFVNLSSIWNGVETESKQMGEWVDLMTWTIFSNLHAISKREYQKGGRYISLEQLNREEVKKKFEENLQASDYEDMLIEYRESNSL